MCGHDFKARERCTDQDSSRLNAARLFQRWSEEGCWDFTLFLSRCFCPVFSVSVDPSQFPCQRTTYPVHMCLSDVTVSVLLAWLKIATHILLSFICFKELVILVLKSERKPSFWNLVGRPKTTIRASRNVAQQICMTSGQRCWGAMFRHLVDHRHMVALLSCVSRYGLALRSCRHQTAQLGRLLLGLIQVHVTLGSVGAGGDKTFGKREGYVYKPSCCRGVLNDNDMLAYSDAEVADFFRLLDVGVG